MLLVVVNLNCVCNHHWWYISSSLAAIGIWFIWWRYPPSWCGNMFTSCLNAGLAPGGMEVNFYCLQDLETKHNDLIWKVSSPKQNNCPHIESVTLRPWGALGSPLGQSVVWYPGGEIECVTLMSADNVLIAQPKVGPQLGHWRSIEVRQSHVITPSLSRVSKYWARRREERGRNHLRQRCAHHIVICSSESSATESLMDDWHWDNLLWFIIMIKIMLLLIISSNPAIMS